MDDLKTRQAVIDACLWMEAAGLVQGTSGNISVRTNSGMLVTPSGVPYADLRPESLAAMPLDGSADWEGPLKPS